jgi:hypothetical protein
VDGRAAQTCDAWESISLIPLSASGRQSPVPSRSPSSALGRNQWALKCTAPSSQRPWLAALGDDLVCPWLLASRFKPWPNCDVWADSTGSSGRVPGLARNHQVVTK